jgi:tRNA U34 2-thiouridine synthase MnmA/TrmU
MVRAHEPAALRLQLLEPVRAITPGQSGVLYDTDGRLLGGGVIG